MSLCMDPRVDDGHMSSVADPASDPGYSDTEKPLQRLDMSGVTIAGNPL
jgi:hypothetical protein